MRRPWSHLFAQTRRIAMDTARRKRRRIPEVVTLEGRALLSLAVTELKATPTILWPPNGRYVPVTVTGKLLQFEVVTVNNKTKVVTHSLPGEKRANFEVTDEYRRFEPRGPVHLVDNGGGKYSFAFTLKLPASRSTEYPAGRRYYITFGAMDRDGWANSPEHTTVAVQVPIDPKHRGDPPQKIPKRTRPLPLPPAPKPLFKF